MHSIFDEKYALDEGSGSRVELYKDDRRHQVKDSISSAAVWIQGFVPRQRRLRKRHISLIPDECLVMKAVDVDNV